MSSSITNSTSKNRSETSRTGPEIRRSRSHSTSLGPASRKSRWSKIAKMSWPGRTTNFLGLCRTSRDKLASWRLIKPSNAINLDRITGTCISKTTISPSSSPSTNRKLPKRRPWSAEPWTTTTLRLWLWNSNSRAKKAKTISWQPAWGIWGRTSSRTKTIGKEERGNFLNVIVLLRWMPASTKTSTSRSARFWRVKSTLLSTTFHTKSDFKYHFIIKMPCWSIPSSSFLRNLPAFLNQSPLESTKSEFLTIYALHIPSTRIALMLPSHLQGSSALILEYFWPESLYFSTPLLWTSLCRLHSCGK